MSITDENGEEYESDDEDDDEEDEVSLWCYLCLQVLELALRWFCRHSEIDHSFL